MGRRLLLGGIAQPPGRRRDLGSLLAPVAGRRKTALKLRRALANVRQILAIELLLAAQALDFRAPLTPGRGSAAALAALRARVRPLAGDRYLKTDLDDALAACGDVLAAVESAVGALA
jgi:histidine ammonia-lyase